MGHGMANNIRRKIPKTSELIVYDVNPEAITRIIDENPGMSVRAASSPKDVADIAVRPLLLSADESIWYLLDC